MLDILSEKRVSNMFSGNFIPGVVVKKGKTLRRQRRAYLRDSFVSYSLSTSRIPHTYLPTLGLYDYFAQRSVEGARDLPQPLSLLILSYLYCVAANEMSLFMADNIIGIMLKTFNAAYKNYVDPTPVGSIGPKEDDFHRAIDFIMFAITVKFELGRQFKINYPGSFLRLEYVVKKLIREYEQAPFAAPYQFIENSEPDDPATIQVAFALLKEYKEANSPDYHKFKQHILATLDLSKMGGPGDNGINVKVVTEKSPVPTPVTTLKRSSSADSFFSQPRKIVDGTPRRTSAASSLDLKQQEESEDSLLALTMRVRNV
jgi:hypothetical protein